MGVVYRAYDPDLDRAVAIKLLLRRGPGGNDLRLVREAQAIARVTHPHVVSIFDVGVEGALVFIAMQLITGVTLAEWLKEERSLEEILGLFEQAGQGLAAAHRSGIIHRDFKPSNVIVDGDRQARVVDFGLARAVSGSDASTLEEIRSELGEGELELDVTLTNTGCVMGTRGYIAPELYQGQTADQRSDQYAFSVSLAQALGRSGSSEAPLLLESLKRRGGIPAWLAELVARGMAANPADRYASMDELLDELRRYRRKRWRGIVVGGVVLLALSPIAFTLFRSEQVLSPCATADREMTAIWNDDVRAATRDAFVKAAPELATPSWQQTERILDGYGTSWIKERRALCEGRADNAFAVTADPRWRCLDRRRDELRELVVGLGHSDRQGITRAVAAASQLLPISLCQKVENNPEASAASALEVEVVRARSLFELGRFAAAETVLEPLIEKARADGDPLLMARVQYLRGRLWTELDDIAQARRILDEAATLADQAGSDWLRLRIFIALMRLDEGTLGDIERFDSYAAQARTVLARLGSDPLGKIELLTAQATQALVRSDPRRGLELAEEVQGLQHAWLPADHPSHIETLSLVGRLHSRVGDRDRGMRELQQAERLARTLFGDEHPMVARLWMYQSGVQRFRGENEEAVRLARLARERLEAFYGPTNPLVLQTHTNLAATLLEREQSAEAIEIFENLLAVEESRPHRDANRIAHAKLQLGLALARDNQGEAAEPYLRQALETLRTNLGSNHTMTAIATDFLALSLFKQKKYEQSCELRRQALDSLRANDPKHPDQIRSIRGLAKCLFAQGRHAEALPELERARTLLATQKESPRINADVEFLTAQALFVAAGQKARARELARLARDHYGEAGLETNRQEIEDWLRTNFGEPN